MNPFEPNLRIPGPTSLPDAVREAGARQMVNHRGPEFAALQNGIIERLKKFYKTDNDVLIVTAAVLIPVRAFVLCAALFHAPDFLGKFRKIWPFLLLFDELWSLAPFLLLHHINFGLALASTTLLVYSPFAQRSLVLMGAGQPKPDSER